MESKIIDGGSDKLLENGFYFNTDGGIIFVYNSQISEHKISMGKETWIGRKYDYWDFSKNEKYSLTNGIVLSYSIDQKLFQKLTDKNLIEIFRNKILWMAENIERQNEECIKMKKELNQNL